jgi:hypothetical protein
MKIKIWSSIALASVFLTVGLSAQSSAKHEMSAEEKAGMEAMMKAAAAGAEHKLLGDMVGTFKAKVTMYMAPGAPPTVSYGTSVNTWVLGGRDVQQKFTGNMMGSPFHGIGYTGYDNLKKEYWGTWRDDMSTGIMTSTGNTADGGKTWKFASVATDPMTGKDSKGEMVITVVDSKHHNMEMWGEGPDGKTFKMMEIAYTRTK